MLFVLGVKFISGSRFRVFIGNDIVKRVVGE